MVDTRRFFQRLVLLECFGFSFNFIGFVNLFAKRVIRFTGEVVWCTIFCMGY